ncbi:MAG: hypothetical protein IKJ83_00170 [Ruminococcus sp.]|nr:hypothetical protein [Ruminococcus sp.]
MGASKKKAGHYIDKKKKKNERQVMSFEELPLDEYEKEEKKKRKIKLDKKKILIAAAILVGLVLTVLVYFTRDVLFGCNRHKDAHNFSAAVSGTSVDSGNFREFAEGLCYASDTNVVYLDSKGEEMFSHQHGFARPVLKTRGSNAIVYDLGANRFSVYNEEGETFTTATEEKIFLADIDSQGNYILVTKPKDFNAKLYAFNKENNTVYTYSFAEYQITSAAVSNDGKSAAVCGVSADNGSRISALYVLSFDKTEPVAKHQITDDLLYDCAFLASNSVCAIGQDGAYVSSGKNFGYIDHISYGGMSLSAYDMNSDVNSLVLSLSRSGNGRNCNIQYVDASGDTQKIIETSFGIASLSTYKDRIAFSDNSNIYLYKKNGDSVSSYSISSAKQVRLYTIDGVYILGLNGITGVEL